MPGDTRGSKMSISVTELEEAISDANRAIEFNDSFQRLKNNPDFKKVILERYIRDRSINLVSYRGNPNLDRREQDQADLDIVAIGRLTYFFDVIEQNAIMATKTKDDCRAQIVEIETNEEDEE